MCVEFGRRFRQKSFDMFQTCNAMNQSASSEPSVLIFHWDLHLLGYVRINVKYCGRALAIFCKRSNIISIGNKVCARIRDTQTVLGKYEEIFAIDDCWKIKELGYWKSEIKLLQKIMSKSVLKLKLTEKFTFCSASGVCWILS